MIRFFPLTIILICVIFSFAVSIPNSPFLINGMTQKMISDKFFTTITPAGFIFSIWSVIYLSWIILGVLLIKKDKIKITFNAKIKFLISIILSAVWLVPWSFLYIEVAFMVMCFILAFLWATFYEIKKTDRNYSRYVVELFLGWIHIAFFANLAVLLHYWGFAKTESIALLIGQVIFAIAGLLTLYFQIIHKTYIISLVFLWACFGIYMSQNPSDIVYEVMFFGVLVILLILITPFIHHKKIS